MFLLPVTPAGSSKLYEQIQSSSHLHKLSKTIITSRLLDLRINRTIAMKNIMIVTALACAGLLAACSGDRTPQTGKDTVKNTYGVAKDTSKMDTAKKQGIDNSAAGGTDLVSDTSKRDKGKK